MEIFIKVLNVAMIIISIEWIGGCIYFGRKKTLEREKRCTEIVKAHINAAEDHYFFFAKYYSLSLSYQYNDKEYHVRKGWFRKELCEEDIDIHINPNNPEECYIKTLKERCRCCK